MISWKKPYEYHLYLGRTPTAEEAVEWGLVNEVVPLDQPEARVEDAAARIARMLLSTIMAIKTAVKRAWEMMGMRVHLQCSTGYITICSGASDVQQYMAQRNGARPRQFAARPVDEGSDSATR